MSEATKTCPVCGEQILAVARKCKYCGEYLDPTARPQETAPSAVERALIPVGRPMSAIVAGYMGLLAFFPLVGFVFGIAGIISGLAAMKRFRQEPVLSGRGRAWFGIIAGALGALVWGLAIVAGTIGALTQP